jgi:hypothetical protein
MKKTIAIILNAAALLFAGYLMYEWIERAFLDGPGDALIPLIIMILIIMGSAIFQQCLEIKSQLQEIKLANVMFVSQSRTETEYLRSLSDYLHLTLEKDKQKPDLN